jgi:predicted  nucleic acid-binding Zn-ribbon protein
MTKIAAPARRQATCLYASFGPVRYSGGRVINNETGEGGSVKGARAAVETCGQLERRITVTRVLATGIFALALRKKKDNRELFLSVEGDGFAFVVEVDPKKGLEARQFAAKINTAGAQ